MKKYFIFLLLFSSLILIGCSSLSITSPLVQFDVDEYVGRSIYPDDSMIGSLQVELKETKIRIGGENGTYKSFEELKIPSKSFEGVLDKDYLGYNTIRGLHYTSFTDEEGNIRGGFLFNSKENDLLLAGYSYNNKEYTILTCYRLFKKEFKRPSDFELEFWIEEVINTTEIGKHDYFTDDYHYPGFEILDKAYCANYQGTAKVRPDYYVSYCMDYPEGKTAKIEKIVITDPAISIYGFNVGMTYEEFVKIFKNLGFDGSGNTMSLGKYIVTVDLWGGHKISISLSPYSK